MRGSYLNSGSKDNYFVGLTYPRVEIIEKKPEAFIKKGNFLNIVKNDHMNQEETKNPWTTLSKEKVYESPWISLTNHDVLTPNGKPGIYGTVHFKNLAIGILPLDKDFNTWIVGQYRFPLKEFTWEIPEGGGKLDVDPLESAKRELSEETGISAGNWTKIQEMHLSNSVSDEYCVLFIAQDLNLGEAHPDDDEEIICKKLPFEKLYEMVIKGEVKDSMTVAAVLKTKILILEGKI